MKRDGSRMNHAGFTLVELLVAFAVLATLTMIAIPVYVSARALAEQRTCFQNQNTLARAAEVYLSVDVTFQRTDLAGLVNSAHPIIVNHVVGQVPTCPSGDPPVDPDVPSIAEGAYQYDASGSIMGCTLGDLGPHGRYDD